MYIGLDVGGTNLVAGLVDREGKILHKAACPVDRSWTAEELSARLARLARQAAQADAEVVKSDSTPGQSQDVQPTQGQMPDPPEVPEKKE